MYRFSTIATIVLIALGAGKTAAEPMTERARLALQKRDAARKTFEITWLNYRENRAVEEQVYRWSVRWLEAERQLSDRQADQVAAYAAHHERMIDIERILKRLRVPTQVTADAVSAAEYYRVEAELWLLQAKEKKKP